MKFALTPQAQLLNGRVHTTEDPTSAYGIPVDTYGTGDFTLEFGFRVESVKGVCCPLIAHWHTQKRTHPENHISIAVLPGRHVQVLVGNGAEQPWIAALSKNPIGFGVDYTLVLEREGSEVCLYLNGILVSFFQLSGPTFFQAHQLLSYHTGEVTGGRRTIWGLRIARNSIYKGSVTQLRAFPDFELVEEVLSSPTMVQFRFKGGETIDDVNGAFATLGGTASAVEGELITTTANTSRFNAPSIVITANEDFTIELEVFPISLGSVGASLIGTWNSGISSNNGWLLYIARDMRVTFGMSTDGTTYPPLVYYTDTLPLNRWSHVAIIRKNGQIRAAINGVMQSAVMQNNQGSFNTTVQLTTSWNDTSGWMNGKRRNIRISKTALYEEDFVPPTELPEYVRAIYSPADAAAIVVQVPLRRESTRNEAGDNDLVLAGGATVANSRINTQANTSSYFSVPSRAFGQGDFTIEFSIRPTAVHSTWGACIIGEWHAASVATDANRWAFFVYSNRSISFALARSANANDAVAVSSAAGVVPLGTDSHIVVERVSGVVTVYIDGVSVASSTQLNFPIRGSAPYTIRSLSAQNAYTYAGQTWNIRIADKAMYNGQVPRTVRTFPALYATVTPVIDIRAGVLPAHAVNVGCTLSPAGVSIPPGGYISLPYDGKYALARDDFTIDAVMTVRSFVNGTGPAAGTSITTLVTWGTWAATNQPLSYEVAFNNLANILGVNSSRTDPAQNKTVSYVIPINQKVNIRVVRQRSRLHIYVDGVLLQSNDYPVNLAADAVQPLLIGRRRGGSSGEAIWSSDMLLESLTVTKEAIFP